MKIINNKKGFSLVEILLAIGVFAIFTTGITYLSIDTITRDSQTVVNNEALLYAQEGLEATRNIRDKSFLAITNGDHGLDFTGNIWSFGPAPENIDSYYQRTITVSDVYRDTNGNIDPDGTVNDPDTKKVDSTISWTQNGIIPHSITLTAYLSNWRADDWIVTTCTEFNGGTFDNTAIVDLPAPPDANCGVQLMEIEAGSSFLASSDVGKHGSDVDVDGNYAYLATDDTNRGINIIDVTNRQSPAIVGFKNIGGKGRFATKDGNYAYMGVSKSNGGLVIVDVSNPASPSVTSTINLGEEGNQSAITGNYLYAASAKTVNSLNVYNITTKSSPVLVKTLNFGDAIHVIKIRGNYAYIGLYDDYTGLRILDISNPANPQQVGSLNVGEEVQAIELNGNIAYIGTEDDDNALKVVDITNPAAPALITSVDANGEIQDLVMSGEYLYAAIDQTQSGMAAINISNIFAPYYVYSLDVGGKGTGIDADADYVYVSTDTANKGLVIVGETVTGSVATGSYISDVLDTGSSDALYNFIEWDNQEVPGSSIQFQIRTADSVANLASATWVGVDGTNSTYYENSRTAITLSTDSTGSRYLQYKAILSSDGVSTPVLDSVRINYTP